MSSVRVLSSTQAWPTEVDSAVQVGLSWLIRLRWGASIAQVLVLVLGVWFFGISVWLPPAVVLACFTPLTNIIAQLIRKKEKQTKPWHCAALLGFDMSVLMGLLWASGGASNPFSVFFLVHVALAAVLLEGRLVWVLATWSSLMFGLLFVVPMPEGTDPMAGHAHMIAGHLRGMWLAYTLASFFVAHFVGRLSRALENREEQVRALLERAERTERLASLSTLAAGAAHELGTPLSTIAVLSKELTLMANRDPACAHLVDDTKAIRSEVERCRQIVYRMSAKAGELAGETPENTPVLSLIKDVRSALQSQGVTDVEFVPPQNALSVFCPRKGLVECLFNLIRNAIDAQKSIADTASNDSVVFTVERNKQNVQFRIVDHGPGIPESVLERIGEPFFTTKETGKGMGLGLFLARSFVERLGGQLSIKTSTGVGTEVTVELPTAQELS